MLAYLNMGNTEPYFKPQKGGRGGDEAGSRWLKALLVLSLDSIQNSVVTFFILNWGLIWLGLCFRLIPVAAGWAVILRNIKLEVWSILHLLEFFQRITRITEVEVAKRWQISEMYMRWNRQDLVTNFGYKEWEGWNEGFPNF